MKRTIEIHDGWLARPEDLRKILTTLAGLECPPTGGGPRPAREDLEERSDPEDRPRGRNGRYPGDDDRSQASDDDEEEAESPPTDGRQLLGWAAKQVPDAKGRVIALGKKRGYPSRILDWTPQQVTAPWHIVHETGTAPKPAPGTNVVWVDLGEVHPAVVGDEHETTIVACRERRHEIQGHAKRLADIDRAIARKVKGSKRHRCLVAAKARMKAKHAGVMRDMEHKISRAVVDTAVERKAGTIVIGDVRDAADGVDLGRASNQKVSQWNHGKIRRYVAYKAEAEGLAVELADDAYTSQTCPSCRGRHKQ